MRTSVAKSALPSLSVSVLFNVSGELPRAQDDADAQPSSLALPTMDESGLDALAAEMAKLDRAIAGPVLERPPWMQRPTAAELAAAAAVQANSTPTHRSQHSRTSSFGEDAERIIEACAWRVPFTGIYDVAVRTLVTLSRSLQTLRQASRSWRALASSCTTSMEPTSRNLPFLQNSRCANAHIHLFVVGFFSSCTCTNYSPHHVTGKLC